jgi:hypothetical protein
MSSNESALRAVPQMQELSDENLREMMGGDGGCGNFCTYTCECSCSLCTSWIYACTSAVQQH